MDQPCSSIFTGAVFLKRASRQFSLKRILFQCNSALYRSGFFLFCGLPETKQLTESQRAKNFPKEYRDTALHKSCNTPMSREGV